MRCRSMDVEFANAAPGIRTNRDARKHSVCQSEIVCCGHAVDQQANLIAARDGIDHGSVVRPRPAVNEAADDRPVGDPQR